MNPFICINGTQTHKFRGVCGLYPINELSLMSSFTSNFSAPKNKGEKQRMFEPEGEYSVLLDFSLTISD